MGDSATRSGVGDYLDFLGGIIPADFASHAILMVTVWFIMVPICILAIRFGKPKPTFHGIRAEIRLRNPEWWWFSTHKFGLYIAIGLGVIGATTALIVSGGFSGSVHSVFGIATVVLGCAQIVSSWLRGKHGGRYYHDAVPGNPESWRGDHYDMTPRRRKFEAFHKTCGYFVGFCATGAVATGLMQYPVPGLAIVVVFAALVIFAMAATFEYKGYRHDGYRAAFGFDPEHPYNKARSEL